MTAIDCRAEAEPQAPGLEVETGARQTGVEPEGRKSPVPKRAKGVEGRGVIGGPKVCGATRMMTDQGKPHRLCVYRLTHLVRLRLCVCGGLWL